MEWTIRPGAIDLLCRDQEFTSYQHQQKSTSETIIKKEGWWQRFTKQVKNLGGAPDHALSGGKHGVAHKVHTGGQSRRRCRAGAGETGNHEFYTIGQIRYEALAFDRAAG